MKKGRIGEGWVSERQIERTLSSFEHSQEEERRKNTKKQKKDSRAKVHVQVQIQVPIGAGCEGGRKKGWRESG